jgi:hypothetical protein
MKNLADGADGLNDEAFDRMLGCERKRMRASTVSVFGLRDGQHTAGTKFLIGKIKDLGAKVVLASTGRVSIVTATGARRVYTLELDQRLVDDSRMGHPSAEVHARLRTANSTLTQALADLIEARS